MTHWAILTGEYPPQPGGVSDYTRLVARALAAAGDGVCVYAPGTASGVELADPRVTIRRLPGRFGPSSLAILDRFLAARPRPDRVLVQYVPHAFGYKAMNLPFATWLAARAGRVASVWVMFHEVAFPFSWRPVKHAVLAGVNRVMARLVAGAAERVLVAIPAWGRHLKRLCPSMPPAEWLPVPCNVATDADPAAVKAVRDRFAAPGGLLVGHFGTFGPPVLELVERTVVELLRLVPAATVLLVGRNGERFRDEFVKKHPELAGRLAAAGQLEPGAVAAHLRACDLLVQPYPDGVSSRRTSAMAGLANGVPVVTNLGALSEPVWVERRLVTTADPDPTTLARNAAALLTDPAARAELGRRGADLYRDTFALEHTITRLRRPT